MNTTNNSPTLEQHLLERMELLHKKAEVPKPGELTLDPSIRSVRLDKTDIKRNFPEYNLTKRMIQGLVREFFGPFKCEVEFTPGEIQVTNVKITKTDEENFPVALGEITLIRFTFLYMVIRPRTKGLILSR